MSMTSSLSGVVSEEEQEQEINVDSGNEEGEDDDQSAPSLPFSISRLLGESPRRQEVVAQGATNLCPQLPMFAPGGVIRVPAQRPPPPGFPWLAMDPTSLMHRSAAAAAFASHLVKERLSGE